MSSHIRRVVESDVPVKSTDPFEVFGSKVKTIAVQVLNQTSWIGGLRDDGKAALSGPSKKYLSRTFVVLLRTLIDYWLIKESWRINGLLHLEFNK
jgi:hypothetical protein